MSEPIRYSRLAYVALDVTDVTASTRFYGELVGLGIAGADEREARLRCSDKPFDLLLCRGDVAGLRRVSFELEDIGQIDVARRRLGEHGIAASPVPEQEARSLGFSAGLRCRAPVSGLEVELMAGFGGDGTHFQPSVAQIERLGHVVINVSDFAAAHDFWVEALNFAVSDAVPGRIAFMRCFPNPYHHSLALIAAPADGFNHVNFMVSDIDDVGRAINRMKKNDVPIVFGPGRHLPSGSIFLYFLDPDEMTAEYSFGMEEFDEHDARPARDLDPTPETLDTWGSIPHERFARKGAILSDG